MAPNVTRTIGIIYDGNGFPIVKSYAKQALSVLCHDVTDAAVVVLCQFSGHVRGVSRGDAITRLSEQCLVGYLGQSLGQSSK